MSAKRLGFAALIFAGGSCYLTPPPSYPTGTAPEAQVAEPPPHQPQPQESWEPTEPGTTIDVDQIPPEEAAPEVEVFYDSLAPYGSWNDDAEWGRVWIPSDASYRPYQRGYWQPTDYGFTWIAEEPFGWAVCHYGRWFVWNGRWAWKPDTVWGPAWVEWREADGYLGWAPLPPRGRRRIVIQENDWRFVPAHDITRVDIPSVYARVDGRVVFRSSRPIVRYTRTRRGEVYVAGPDPEVLRTRHNVTVVPSALPPRLTGRYDRDAWRDRRLRDERRRAEEVDWRRQRDERQTWQADQRRMQEEQQRLETERRAHEERRSHARDEAERRRLEAEQRRIDEHQRRLEAERRQRDEQARRYAEDQRRLREQQRLEGARQAEEQQRRQQAEEQRRQQEAERARREQERQQAEQMQRRQQDEERARREAEKQQAEEMRRRQQDEEKARREQEQQQRRQQAEDQRRQQEEQRARGEAEKQQAEEMRRRQQAEEKARREQEQQQRHQQAEEQRRQQEEESARKEQAQQQRKQKLEEQRRKSDERVREEGQPRPPESQPEEQPPADASRPRGKDKREKANKAD